MKNKLIQKAQKLAKLGDKFIEKSGPTSFHLAAKHLLENAQLHEFFDVKELATSTFANNFNHQQNFKHLEFSDLPLTVARGEHCFVDVYFWRRRPTVIHDHHFCGAFQCLLGHNVDSEFTFKTTKKLTKYHSLGEFELKRTRTLNKGDVESINLLNKFIHQNHHQADLTVNLCFRTHDLGKKNLSNYLYSGLKFEKDPRSLARVNRLLAFAKMEELDPKKMDLTLIDAFNFLIMTYYSDSSHPHFLRLKKFFESKVKSETGLRLYQYLDNHEKEMNKIEEMYE